jgi:hypothetical protein
MAEKEQNYSNHARFVPGYHFVAFGIFVVNLVGSVYSAFFSAAPISFEGVLRVLVAVALLLLFFYARTFALTVQDRVIRLEMRLRLEKLIAPDLRARILEFSVRQLVALRFAADEELPDLARKVLSENIRDSKTIKQMIRRWNPDHLRA